MLLGFISLFMSALATIFIEICVDESSYNRQITICYKHRMRLRVGVQRNNRLQFFNRYVLGYPKQSDHMCPKGKTPFITLEDIHEVHSLLFLTVITHIVYSCMTVVFALLKVQSWRSWENDAHGDGFKSFADISKEASLDRHFMFTLYHTSKPWNFKRFLVWMACFMRQFGKAVERADYLTIRSGFIAAHKLDHSYNFHSYVVRCMEDDFTRIVGISAPLWGFVIICILLNSDGFNLFFYVAFIPMMVTLAVGTKLQHVMATLGSEKLGFLTRSRNKEECQAYEKLFWFENPEYILWLLHFILFENAFELATFIWSLWHFPDRSCVLRNKVLVATRLIFGLILQVLCSYSTLPMYTLATQIGSSFKKSMISQRVQESLHRWHMDAKERLGYRDCSQLVAVMNLKRCENKKWEEDELSKRENAY
ncbi:hypothetical protein KP509_31G053400 [Ceratopteris richardii]|nr:hypothetical protein KP509_31G053400 [Ceratopteris richardii]